MAANGARRAHKLTDAHKSFVVQRLACFDTPKEVAEALKEEFRVEVTPQAIEAYNPARSAGKALAKRWRDMFEAARKDFLANAQSYVPIANKTVRLREMQKAFLAHKGRGNWVGALQVLEQVAKEVGEAFTNQRQITGKDGGPLQVEHSDMTDEQLTARMVQLMSAAMADGGDGAGADG